MAYQGCITRSRALHRNNKLIPTDCPSGPGKDGPFSPVKIDIITPRHRNVVENSRKAKKTAKDCFIDLNLELSQSFLSQKIDEIEKKLEEEEFQDEESFVQPNEDTESTVVEKDEDTAKIVGFLIKPSGNLYYEVDKNHGSGTQFLPSEEIRELFPEAIIDFCEKNKLWRPRPWENFVQCTTWSQKIVTEEVHSVSSSSNNKPKKASCSVQ